MRLFAPLLLLAGLLISQPTLAEPIRVTHAQGEITLPAPPKTVLTFDLATLDTLDALGVAVAGVPGSNIPDYLARYRADAFLKVGSLFEPDFEAVYAAQPDLVIVALRSSPHLEALNKIAPTIDLTVDSRDFLPSALAQARILGKIFAQEAAVEARITKLEATIADTRGLSAKAGRALVVMVSGAKITAYGQGSRFGWLYDTLGFAPAATDLQTATHGEAVSFEYLHKLNPDWLFVLDRDAAVGNAGGAAAKVLDNELMAATNAVRQGRVVSLDPVRWYIVGSGLAALQVMTDDINTALRHAP